MFRSVVFFISFRYTFSFIIGKYSQWISFLSILGIALGVMSLITVFSIMNGFENDLKKNVLEFIPQAIVSSTNGYLNPKKFTENHLKLQGVRYISPVTIGEAIIQSDTGISIGNFLGIDPYKIDPMLPYFINIHKDDLKCGKYNLIIGEKLADMLNVSYGDQIRIIVPSINQLTPFGNISSQRLFNVIGKFKTDKEIDFYQVLINIQDASRLMHYPDGNITGWRLWLFNPLKVNSINQRFFNKKIVWKDWRESKGELFQAIRMEKNVMGLLLSLIIIIAIFNLITSMWLMITEKRNEIAILKTQGLKKIQVMKIFIIKGTMIGFMGSLLGMIFGLIVIDQIKRSEKYIFNGLIIPISTESFQIFTIVLTTIIMTFFSTLYPSWYASNIHPAESIRYE